MYPKDMDKECVAICNAINSLKGLRTDESCCGHGEHEFRIWFSVNDSTALPILLYYCDPCHVGFRWWCKVSTDCGMSPVYYYIESESIGETAYKEAEIIAEEIRSFVSDEEEVKSFMEVR